MHFFSLVCYITALCGALSRFTSPLRFLIISAKIGEIWINNIAGAVMSLHLQKNTDQRVVRTIKNLKKNNMNGYYVVNEAELIERVKKILPEDSAIVAGGSMTLFESGLMPFLRSGYYNFADRNQKDLTPEEVSVIYNKAFTADGYFASSNAVTESGYLYNVDGRGNRVAAMIYGPKKVILIVGTNKIVKDIGDAIRRNEEIAAPANCVRLNRKTPCQTTGTCSDCQSPGRICNAFTTIKHQGDPGRIHVIFVKGNLGY